MKDYNVIILPQAETDLDEIYNYIANTIQEPGIASNQKNRILDQIRKLNQFPKRCPLFKSEPWYSQGLRYLIVDNYLAVYKIVEESETIAIITIVYAKRNIFELL